MLNKCPCDENGDFIIDENFKEIKVLHQMLKDLDIPHEFVTFLDGYQVIYPCDGFKRVADAVQHSGSYGARSDKLEIMGLLTPEEREVDWVLGNLTAEEVCRRFKEHYDSVKD